MKTTKEMIDVMQAFDRGEKIECFNDEQWKDVNNPIWDWLHNDYRVKQKKKYVPFETIKEFLYAQSIHGRGIIAFGELYTYSYVDCYCNVFLYEGSTKNNFTFNFDTLFENCKFADGTPCGKEVAL